MDNNQPNQAINQNPAPVVPPPMPSVPVQPPKLNIPQTQESGDSKKMILFLILGIVVIVLVVGGIYYYFSNQQSGSDKKHQTPAPQIESTSQNSQPDPLETELTSLTLTPIEDSLTEIDKDLQNL